ncbi:hypothetical protein ACFOPN_20990 [Xanthomonas hyacinthi]
MRCRPGTRCCPQWRARGGPGSASALRRASAGACIKAVGGAAPIFV